MCQAKRGRTGRASRDTPRPKQDAHENKGASQFHAQGPGAHRGRVGCVKQSADAPVAQAETLPVGRHCAGPTLQIPDARCAYQEPRRVCQAKRGRTGRASRDTPGGSALRWTHPTNSRCPMCVPGAA